MFSTLAMSFDVYRDLPSPQHRWLLSALARYADREGCCWPSMRQLAHDAKMSLASVCRYLKSLADLGVFQRERLPGRRYRYTLAEIYRPRWPERVPAAKSGVPARKPGVSGAGTQEAKLAKYGYKQERFADELAESPWPQRIRGWLKDQFWLDAWGPRPNEPGCIASLHLLGPTMRACLTDRRPTDRQKAAG